ncbi:hypothetical protein K439DRAFT_1617760 [Ramaria rubella]|nr:hypothetical protein K439DRAFT_1617760 [Ramaria rubella]
MAPLAAKGKQKSSSSAHPLTPPPRSDNDNPKTPESRYYQSRIDDSLSQSFSTMMDNVGNDIFSNNQAIHASVNYIGKAALTLPKLVLWETTGHEDRCIVKGSDVNDSVSIDLELSFVSEVSAGGFWMTADARWTGKSFGHGLTQLFSKIKGSMVLIRPRTPPWKENFDNVVKALQWLEDNKAVSQGRDYS